MKTDASGERPYKYLITDSRSVFAPSATIFAALQTDVNDGHKYIASLAEKGVTAFIVEKIPEGLEARDLTFIEVYSVKEALQTFASRCLLDIACGIIITGSRGKTKLKELLYQSLLPFIPVCRSPRSWNSAIGVPLSVIEMDMADNRKPLMLTEIGLDGPGQAANYRWLAATHKFGILTPMTAEHDEAFASHADKIREKVDVVRECSTIIYADSDPALTEALGALKKDSPGIRLVAVSVGRHASIYHSLAAATLNELGLSVAAAGIDNISLVETLRNIRMVSYGNTLIRDNFTNDVRSLRDSLDYLRRNSTPVRDTVLILDDLAHPVMALEQLRKLYKDAVEMALSFGVGQIVVVSSEMRGLEIENDVLEYVKVDNGFLTRCQNGDVFRNKQLLLFGPDDYSLQAIELALEQADHDTTLEIDLDAVAHNYNYFRSLVPVGTGLVGMVKASAYGTGAVEIGKTLQSLGAAYLAVAVVDEGVALREAGINMDIMVLNPVTNRYPALFGHNLEPAVFSLLELDRLIKEAETAGLKHYPVHVKLDTGMHRVGFLRGQIDGIVERLASTTAVYISSVFSHLATADCLDMDAYTQKQVDDFYSMTGYLRSSLGYDFKRHILNTAGMMRYATCGNYEMARLGIGLYGISPYTTDEKPPLKPVASLFTRIISLKRWPENTPIGYGCRGVTSRESLIATIPVGYADGINRHFGCGKASFVVNGVECPTIGNICMDLCMLDVTDVADVKVGDRVEIFGRNMPIERLADILGTIPYEVLTSVSQRVRRTYFGH